MARMSRDELRGIGLAPKTTIQRQSSAAVARRGFSPALESDRRTAGVSAVAGRGWRAATGGNGCLNLLGSEAFPTIRRSLQSLEGARKIAANCQLSSVLAATPRAADHGTKSEPRP